MRIGSGSTTELVVYNAQHEDLVEAMVAGFTKETGIKVEIRNGSDFELANQIVQEGAASPADVFLTENSPAMTLVVRQGPVRPGRRRPRWPRCRRSSARRRTDWVGFAARSTVLVYNTDSSVPRRELPASIMDLADPEWKGQVGIAPTGADFQAIVSAVSRSRARRKAKAWLDGPEDQRARSTRQQRRRS